MEKIALKDLLYGGISELIRNNKLYRRSPISDDYSHFTDEGGVAVKEFIQAMAILIYIAEEKELDERAKDMVIKGLKGETL
jgi:hypothetical protein